MKPLRKVHKKLVSIVLAFAMTMGVFSGLIHVSAATGNYGDTYEPYIQITEMKIYNSGTEGATKFIELYNASSYDVNLSTYELRYLWSQSSSAKYAAMSFPANTIIKAGATLLVVDPTATAAKLNSFFGTSLTSDKLVPILSAGMAYSARGIGLFDKANNAMVCAAMYSTAQAGKSQEYFYKGTKDTDGVPIMESDGSFGAPTPGALVDGQAPSAPTPIPQALLAPVLTSSEMLSVSADQAKFSIQCHYVATQNAATLPSVKLYYSLDDQQDFSHSIDLQPSAGQDTSNSMLPISYEAVIPAGQLTGVSRVFYYYEVSDGVNITRTPSGTGYSNVEIYHTPKPVTADILITELLPTTTNNKFNYIELYNNTNRPINLNDYRLIDQTSNGSNTFYDFNQDKTVQPKGIVVVWAQTSANMGESIDDFNANYHTSLTSDQIVTLDKPFSMSTASTTEERILVATVSGDTDGRREGDVSGVKVRAIYGRKSNEAIANRSIQYSAPVDGSDQMLEVNYNQDPTPGTVDPSQVPATPIQHPDDTQAPALSYTDPGTVDYGSLNLQLQATDDQEVKKVTLYYHTQGETAYQSKDMILSSDMNSTLPANTYTILNPFSADDLAKVNSLSYYFVVSDGYNQTRSADYTLSVNHPELAPLAFNIQENANITRSNVMPDMIITEAEIFNGQAQKFIELYNSSGHDLNLADYQYRYWWGTAVSSYNTYTFPADAQTFKAGSVILLTDPTMPADKFNQTYGTTLTDQQVMPVLFAGIAYADRGIAVVKADTQQVVCSAAVTGTDASAGKTVVYQYDYDSYQQQIPLMNRWKTLQTATPGSLVDGQIPQAMLPIFVNKPADSSVTVTAKLDGQDIALTDHDTSYAYYLDVDSVSEGKHTLTVTTSAGETKTLDFVIDNTQPTISNVSVGEGQTYEGSITFNADIADATSGLQSTSALLDGKSIALGTAVKAGSLTKGAHVFEISAVDKAGNSIVRNVHFNTSTNQLTIQAGPAASNPDASTALNLSVNPEESTKLDATFYQAYQYNFSNNADIKAFMGSSSKEPPAELNPAGETALTSSQTDCLKKVDDQGVTNTATDDFPYQRYDFTVQQNLSPNDDVEITWNGSTLQDRTIIIYFWNYTTNSWVEATRGSGTSAFDLVARAKASDVVSGNVVHVLVQDPNAAVTGTGSESSSTGNDNSKFTFAWMPDTQYYSESFPYIWDSMTSYLTGPARQERNIQYLMQTGDLVDEYNLDYQWQRTSNAFKVFENACLPYGVVAGNHDVDHENGNWTNFQKYFGTDRVSKQSVFGGDYDDDRDHYDLVSVNGYDFIIVYLGWRVQQADIDWANKVLKANPDRYAIVATHEYLSTDGVSYSGDGQKIWDNVVNPNSNVFMVICGHLHGAAHNEVTASDGRKVTQILADYQDGKEGGLGYTRFFEFDMANKVINVSTYSPYTGLDNYFGESTDNFTIDISGMVKSPEKEVTTNYINLNVYTDTVIGSANGLQVDPSAGNGQPVSVQWNNLVGGQNYSWFAKGEDVNGNVAYSSIASFTQALPPAPTVADVAVSPSAATVQQGDTKSFSASVTGDNNPAQTVTWSVSGNTSSGTTISDSGLLTVASDETAATLIVKATSTVDSSKSGTASVSVTTKAPPASEKTLTGIGIQALPARTTYVAGQSLDLAEATIKLDYSDQSYDVIAVQPSMVSAFNSTKAGKQTLTVTYQGKTAAFDVNVISALISDDQKTATVDLSGAGLPSNVSSLTLSAQTLSTSGAGSENVAVVQNLLGSNAKGLVVYNLKLLDQNGNPVENFTGKIKVKLPIPEGLSGDLHVYWYDPDTNKLIDMNATVDGNYLVFDTTHFSDYAIIQLTATTPADNGGTISTGTASNPNTGDNDHSTLVFVVIALSAVAAMYGSGRKRLFFKRKFR